MENSSMEAKGYEYLRESCLSVLTELLEYVAKTGKHSIISSRHASEVLDGSNNMGRRVNEYEEEHHTIIGSGSLSRSGAVSLTGYVKYCDGQPDKGWEGQGNWEKLREASFEALSL
ncbi:BTB/POZ and MATH domain-containing protein 1 [Nymphaea thermarum]|nr:BTB/POZ and MATH domain-containing protein 1 [Nymphaea thermarum]